MCRCVKDTLLELTSNFDSYILPYTYLDTYDEIYVVKKICRCVKEGGMGKDDFREWILADSNNAASLQTHFIVS